MRLLEIVTVGPSHRWLILVSGVMLAASSCASDEQPAEAGTESKPYAVECGSAGCLVDRQTFIGWRTYHAFCHVCHAQDAVGSTFAPSLLDRLQQIDKARFLDVVANGYTGQVGVMPPWKENPNVNKRYEELWAYLKARADGVLAPGRPEWKPQE